MVPINIARVYNCCARFYCGCSGGFNQSSLDLLHQRQIGFLEWHCCEGNLGGDTDILNEDQFRARRSCADLCRNMTKVRFQLLPIDSSCCQSVSVGALTAGHLPLGAFAAERSSATQAKAIMFRTKETSLPPMVIVTS